MIGTDRFAPPRHALAHRPRVHHSVQRNRSETLRSRARCSRSRLAFSSSRDGSASSADAATARHTLGGGEILGEMALLTGSPRMATARAVTTVTVGEIEREAFENLMLTQPHVRDAIWRSFAERRFETTSAASPATHISTVSIAAAGSGVER